MAKIRLKFGQVQAQANSGALILSKTFKGSASNSNNNSIIARPAQECSAVSQPPAAVITTSKPIPVPVPVPIATPMPTPMPMPMPMSTNVVLPELKISALPAAMHLNGAKIMQVQGGTLTVVMPPLTPAPTLTTISTNQERDSSAKLQRSKSLAGNNENDAVDSGIQNNSTERRHSVAIMSKEVDVEEQPKTIETITIDDDDSEEEMEQEKLSQQLLQKEQQTGLPEEELQPEMSSVQTSRKNSTASRSSIASVASVASSSSIASVASSSSVEMIMPTATVKPEQPEQQQPQLRQLEQQAEQNTHKISIVKAESLSVSKEEFEKSLHCTEKVDPNSPPFTAKSRATKPNQTSSGTITLTPISRLQSNGVDNKPAASNFKRNMQLNFGMLRWREQQPGALQNSTMRFELNNFNLLQLSERCERRKGPANYFERALLDRPGRRPNSSSHPLLYLCSRCNCHGPASDFLAPRE